MAGWLERQSQETNTPHNTLRLLHWPLRFLFRTQVISLTLLQWLFFGEGPPGPQANRPLLQPFRHARGDGQGSELHTRFPVTINRHLLGARGWGVQDGGLLSLRSCCGNLYNSSLRLAESSLYPSWCSSCWKGMRTVPTNPHPGRGPPLH